MSEGSREQLDLDVLLLKDEPLISHPVYEKVASLPRTGGPGPFSQVACHRPTGELVQIKFIPRGWDAAASANCERTAINHMELSMCSHPHVTEFKAVFLTPYYLALVTEYVEGETIETFLEKIGGRVIEGLARFIMQQLILAVDYCHQNLKVLRDIKLGNTLLIIPEGQLPILKLWDFSVCKDLQRDTEAMGQVGTVLFAAPEVLQASLYPPSDGKAADIWACGIMMYIMLFGQHPFLRDQDSALSQDQRMLTMLQRTLRGDAEYPREVCSSLSPACLDLLRRIIQVDPNQRASMRQIMQHPWFLEALPEGAGSMNDVFVAQSQRLAPEEVQQFRCMVQKASVDDGDCQLPAPDGPAPGMSTSAATQSAPRSSAGAAAARSTCTSSSKDSHTMMVDGSTSQRCEAPDAGAGAGAGPTEGAASAPAPAVSPPPPQARVFALSAEGMSGPSTLDQRSQQSLGLERISLDQLSQPSDPMMASFIESLDAIQTCDSGLANLEDAIMRIPSTKLLLAATEDIFINGMPRLESQPSPVAPRTGSELERDLMASSSFMREFMQARLVGMVRSEAAGPGAEGAAGLGDPDRPPQHHLEQAFSYDSSADLARAVWSLADDFDWQEFNEIFSRGGSGEGGAPALPSPGEPAAADDAGAGRPSQLASPRNSPWARICLEVKTHRHRLVAQQAQAAQALERPHGAGAGAGVPAVPGAPGGAPAPQDRMVSQGGSAPLIQVYREVSATLSGVAHQAADAAAYIHSRLNKMGSRAPHLHLEL